MNTFKKTVNISGWLVFLISFIVLGSSVESTGSLWDCGEFILGAYKLQVVHPPGAPLFVLVGRMFALMGEVFSSEPSGIAVAVNIMSAMCTAFAAMFVAWVTMILGKMALVGRDTEPDGASNLALAGAGLAAGLATAFSTSIWFSAVEGEVYAMSTFFTALVLWAMVKWYHLPDDPKNDRWVLFAVYAAALSIGVHLLSLLTFPALALFYYYKKFKQPSLKGAIAAAAVGVAFIVGIQSLIITGLPRLWLQYELMMVNGFGFGFHTGLIPLVATVGAILYFSLRYAHKKQNVILQQIIAGAFLSIIGFSTVGIVVIRANANPPVNMNDNYDAARLLPYLNREQYGERPLLRGPQFHSSPIGTKITDRYGRVGDRYEIVDHKVDYEYKDADITLFPRMGHYDERRKQLYRIWMNGKQSNPNFADNIGFFIRYQINWMYWRYFMWNFAGRQNGDQGYFPWDPSRGHWISGIPFVDNARLFDQSTLPTALKEDEARNRYFLLPLLFGILGILFHFRKNRKDFLALLSLFIITGIGIIVYSNQPPNEPRERDYVLVGSFFTFAIWIGMGALYLFQLLREKVKSNPTILAAAASVAVLTAPIIMGFENYDDHSRRGHTASRDYASNFLNSCAPNALIFTYGDNDTYPLWYAQEVEGIRTDVRVVNLSLIAVDWYIDQMRRKVNDSPAIKFTIPKEEYRGKKRNQVFYHSPDNVEREMSLLDALKFIGESHPLRGTNMTTESYLPAKRLYIPINRDQAINSGWASVEDQPDMVDRIYITIENNYLTKDELAILDIIASNIYERPIYFSVTCTEDKLFKLGEHMQLEGLGHRLMPVRSRPTRGLGIYGLGRLGEEAFLDNVLNKFKWSSFAEHKTFVDRSYNASVYAHKMVMLRAAYHFMAKKDYANAIKVIDKSLEAFPHFNFPYDGTTMALLNMYADAEAYDKAKPHMEIMAQHVLEYMEFFSAIGPAKVEAGYSADKRDMDRTMTDLITMAQQAEDDSFAEKLIDMFRPFIDTDALKKQLMEELDPELLEQLQMELQNEE